MVVLGGRPAGAFPAGPSRSWLALGVRLLAALALLGGATSCGSAGAAGSGPAPGPCPAHAPGRAGAAAPVAAGSPAKKPLLRPGPVVAVICQYAANPSLKTSGLLPRVTLRGTAAAGLAAVLDDARPVRPPDCAQLPFRQLIMFGYRHGPVAAADVTFGACSSAAVTVGSRSAVLGSPMDDDLFSYTSLRRHDHGPVTPDVIGLTAHNAALAARRRGFTLLVDGAAFDAAAPLGTVIFQSLPPGAADAGPGLQLDATLAVPHTLACTPAQLAVSYRGGGFGAGNDFGTIVFRDTSTTPCRLAGPVTVTGLNATGRAVTSTAAATFAVPGVLSPGAPPIPEHAAPAAGELAYGWTISAEYRDGPVSVSNGYCQPLWVIPATWRITLAGGATFLIRNADPYDRGLSPTGGLITCQGRLGSALPPSYLAP